MRVDADSEGEWQCIESMLDSGAARSVCPLNLCPENGTNAGKGPAFFKTATGDRVQNHGMRRISGRTDDGKGLTLHYNVADVSSALDSVSQICDKGNVVVFTSTGGFICGPHGKLGFRRKNDTYVRNTWVRKTPKSKSVSTGDSMELGAFPSPDFARQV